jgi:hypothetical protein
MPLRRMAAARARGESPRKLVPPVARHPQQAVARDVQERPEQEVEPLAPPSNRLDQPKADQDPPSVEERDLAGTEPGSPAGDPLEEEPVEKGMAEP